MTQVEPKPFDQPFRNHAVFRRCVDSVYGDELVCTVASLAEYLMPCFGRDIVA